MFLVRVPNLQRSAAFLVPSMMRCAQRHMHFLRVITAAPQAAHKNMHNRSVLISQNRNLHVTRVATPNDRVHALTTHIIFFWMLDIISSKKKMASINALLKRVENDLKIPINYTLLCKKEGTFFEKEQMNNILLKNIPFDLEATLVLFEKMLTTLKKIELSNLNEFDELFLYTFSLELGLQHVSEIPKVRGYKYFDLLWKMAEI